MWACGHVKVGQDKGITGLGRAGQGRLMLGKMDRADGKWAGQGNGWAGQAGR